MYALNYYTLAKSVNLVQWSGKLNLIYCSSCDLPHLFVSFLFCFRMVLADIHEPSIYYKEASVSKKSARFCLKQLSIGEETKKKERKSTDSVNIQVVKGKKHALKYKNIRPIQTLILAVFGKFLPFCN